MRHQPTLLVTGANGQVGFELRRSLAPLGDVIALDRTSCDLMRPNAVRSIVRDLRPDLIFNAAAYTAVDKAESASEAAFMVNETAVRVLAEEAANLGSLFIHYSTDYVFDGYKTGHYVETDTPNPQSVYGKSKLAGEQAIALVGGAALVLRTSWVAGVHGNNFAKTMLRLAQERDSLRVVADQFGAPTTASLVADVTAEIARHWLSGERRVFNGDIYHLAAGGETTWHGYATEVIRYARSKGVEFKVKPEHIEAIPATAYPLPAPRPANSRLDTSRLRKTFDISLPNWQNGIYPVLDQILS